MADHKSFSSLSSTNFFRETFSAATLSFSAFSSSRSRFASAASLWAISLSAPSRAILAESSLFAANDCFRLSEASVSRCSNKDTSSARRSRPCMPCSKRTTERHRSSKPLLNKSVGETARIDSRVSSGSATRTLRVNCKPPPRDRGSTAYPGLSRPRRALRAPRGRTARHDHLSTRRGRRHGTRPTWPRPERLGRDSRDQGNLADGRPIPGELGRRPTPITVNAQTKVSEVNPSLRIR